ncbi:MAG: hypothetical protein KF688_11845 [Pirellulales bacterium]|nr:hypothetical protein [Pirellulales bacterium]
MTNVRGELCRKVGELFFENLRTSFGAGLLCAFGATTPAWASVAIFDGFGDADLNNNGIPLEPADVDVSSSGLGTVGPYVALNNGGAPMIFPQDTMVDEVDTVLNPADTGIRWFSIGGWTGGATPAPRAALGIINDAAGALPETNPGIGFNHSVAGGVRYAEAIDTGYALAFDSKGRGNAAAGFFDNRIELGPEVDDEVRVSFDFRIWYSAQNVNVNTNINHVPAIGEVRFGLFQDTDNQLGQTNPIAGVGSTPAVWGQENGNFRGDAGAVGANGDAGWFVRVGIDDPENSNIDQLPVTSIGRINEERNTGSATDLRIMNGATDFVAGATDSFVHMTINKVYNLSLSLKRFDDPATPETVGDTIYATMTLTERSSGMQWSFGNYERVVNNDVPDGIFSDSWDYFAMTTGGESTSDDFDWLIDNFTVEVFGSNAVVADADFNSSGAVDGADFLVWQRGFGATGQPNKSTGDANGDQTVNGDDLSIWSNQYGGSPAVPAVGVVPEPGCLGLALVGLAGVAVAVRRRAVCG